MCQYDLHFLQVASPLTLGIGHEVNGDVHDQRVLRVGRGRRLQLERVEGPLGAERERELARGRLEVGCVHRRTIAFGDLQGLVAQAADPVDEDALGCPRADLSS